ncbi:hypothetical protein AGOR_G00006470 [Albula goreensis]|uniref:Aminopeptidase n=1 Tax=Albula goreensis TaxID=1534307 RepID=A0A8T3EBC6_9TELE|nr:hypothetical protein AGOR_G00006470 [Albula goreensis]
MSKGIYISKALAVATGVVTVSAVGSIIAMITVFQIQIQNDPPVEPPTRPSTTVEPTGPPPDMRLPRNLIPEEYFVTLQPYLYLEVNNMTNQSFAFSGKSNVTFRCMKVTSRILIHCKDLNITFVKVTDENKTTIHYKKLTMYQNESNFYEIQLRESLKVGNKYKLSTVFEGEMLDDLTGIYVSQYDEMDENGKTLKPSQMQRGLDLRRTWARPEAIKNGHAKFAQSITGDILLFYEDYFGIPYPLSKLDQIALPDFGAGAMENWGMITYRETALLYEEGVSSTSNQEWIATVIAHELAHQWFGNLVTMEWWNDLWLNEGFATYMSYFGVDKVKPDWDLKDMIVLNEMQSVFQVDALATSHPLSSNKADVQTPAEISELFDSITYSKGAVVLRMLSNYIGEAVFLNGLRSYLRAYSYGNADYKDLWSHLQKAVDESQGNQKVEDVMKTWTQQMGFPVIIIDTTTGAVRQQHFLFKQTSNSSFLWQVPIQIKKPGKTEHDLLDEIGPVTKDAYKAKDKEWVLANYNCTGYFRVNYNPENWERLLQQLNNSHDKIPILNRGQLIDDAFNLARAQYVNVTLALNTTKYLSNDMEYIPWESALRNLEYFILMFDRSEVFGPMKAYLRTQVAPLYEHFENYTLNSTVPKSHTAQYNQINSISVACSNDLLQCKEMVKTVFTQWIDDPANSTIHPNLKSTIYCHGITAGGEKEWEIVWERYQKATIATEKDKLRYALSCSKDIWILSRYLQYTLDPTKIRKMDAVSTINYIARNVAGQSLAWDFVESQWTYISEEYGGGIMSLGSLIDGVTQRFSTEFELQKLKRFQEDHGEDTLSSGTRALQQAIERTQANIKWVKENKQTVLNWFLGQPVESQYF